VSGGASTTTATTGTATTPTATASLFAPPPAARSPASLTFERLLLHWSSDRVDPALRWVVTLPDALAWFDELERGAGLDLAPVLEAWGDWLLEQHEAKRRDASRAFVRDWRRSLRAAIKRARETPPSPVSISSSTASAVPPGADHARRGAFLGHVSRRDLPFASLDDLPEWDDDAPAA
jgi:hypothetical protein